jgi:hypothetical protein
MTDIEYIAKGLSVKARKYKDGYITCCPAHDDKDPSLIITPGLSEDFTVHCLAGCDWRAVKDAIKATGLYKWAPTEDQLERLKRGTQKDRFLASVKEALQEARKPFRTVGEFLPYAAALPPPIQLCGPFYSHSSGFIAAPGGSGKSMFTLGLAKALSEGSSFCGWAVPKPLQLFMVDVEMSDSGLFQRLHSLGFHGKHNITLDTSGQRDAAGIDRFSLGPEEVMRQLMAYAHNADVVIIDNVSACLMPKQGGDIFSPEAWQQVFILEQWARQQGKLLIFVDHTNKAGQLAGTLHKHRMADFVVLLERTSWIGEPWLEFLWRMDKVRYDTDPEDVTDRLIRLEDGAWTHSDPMEMNDDILLKVTGGELSKKDAAEQLDMTRVTLDKHLAKFKYRLRRKQNDRANKN